MSFNILIVWHLILENSTEVRQISSGLYVFESSVAYTDTPSKLFGSPSALSKNTSPCVWLHSAIFKKEGIIMLQQCNLCPHGCNIDRSKFVGRCKAGSKVEIGGVSLHKFEEPCISRRNWFWNCFLFKVQFELCILSKL